MLAFLRATLEAVVLFGFVGVVVLCLSLIG